MPRLRNVRLAAVIVVAIAAGAVTWLVLRDGGGPSETPTGKPEVVSVQQLRELAGSVGHPVYWAGQRRNTQLELTRAENGNIFVRYLGPGDQPGNPQPRFLTVGTYPVANAYGALTVVSRRSDSITKRPATGALVVTNRKKPNSVYIAYPRSGIQTEVFDPSGKRALKLAVSGKIQAVR